MVTAHDASMNQVCFTSSGVFAEPFVSEIATVTKFDTNFTHSIFYPQAQVDKQFKAHILAYVSSTGDNKTCRIAPHLQHHIGPARWLDHKA